MSEIDCYKYNLNVRNSKDEIEKLRVVSIKMKLIEKLQSGMKLIKVDAPFGEWYSSAYLKCGEHIVVLRCDESFPNKVNEINLAKEDLEWMVEIFS
ncbi:hypothetical protein ABNX05_11320 [Lysinibacillus sp. M3]|uniref:DUF3892 domain-containing protein n=1 Tax=Lysinibacillus zambalensis TaxID=3160866 RepID=A0ABV1MRS0_9BACI